MKEMYQAKELVQNFGNDQVGSVICPLDINLKLKADEGDLFHDPSLSLESCWQVQFPKQARLGFRCAASQPIYAESSHSSLPSV